jgi:hypothetical protein
MSLGIPITSAYFSFSTCPGYRRYGDEGHLFASRRQSTPTVCPKVSRVCVCFTVTVSARLIAGTEGRRG